jgi:hypothetical protein
MARARVRQLALVALVALLAGAAWLFAVKAIRDSTRVTFARDIAPIGFEHCAPCHRPGQAGPFSLLSYADYRTEVFPGAVLQVGAAREGGDCFDLPGQRIASYYLWLFPNTMLNFYPWGISVNVVAPLSHDRTRITFLSFVWDASRRGSGAGTGLDQVELEDEQLVEWSGVGEETQNSDDFGRKR